MLNTSEQRYTSKYPLFYDIVKKIEPKYNSLQITGNSRTRYLTYTYDNKNYESRSIDGGYNAFFGFIFAFIEMFSGMILFMPNVVWSNFCFYLAQIIFIFLVWVFSDNYKDAIINVTIVFCEMLFVIGGLYWITKSDLHDANNLAVYKNITAIWPKFIFKFPFV